MINKIALKHFNRYIWEYDTTLLSRLYDYITDKKGNAKYTFIGVCHREIYELLEKMIIDIDISICNISLTSIFHKNQDATIRIINRIALSKKTKRYIGNFC